MTDPNPLFELLTKLDLTIGRHSQQLQQAALAATRAVVPESQLRVSSAVVPASGFAVICLGGPTQGYRWNVRRLTVGGLDPSIAAAGRADVFVSGSDLSGITSVAQATLQNWVDFTTTLPAIAYYGDGEVPLKQPERLFIVVSGATNLQEYVGAVMLQNVQDAANAQRLQV